MKARMLSKEQFGFLEDDYIFKEGFWMARVHANYRNRTSSIIVASDILPFCENGLGLLEEKLGFGKKQRRDDAEDYLLSDAKDMILSAPRRMKLIVLE